MRAWKLKKKPVAMSYILKISLNLRFIRKAKLSISTLFHIKVKLTAPVSLNINIRLQKSDFSSIFIPWISDAPYLVNSPLITKSKSSAYDDHISRLYEEMESPRSYSQFIDGKIRLIETSLVCNSFVATSNNSKSSLSSNYISLSVEDIWNSLLACLAFWLLVGI